MQHAELESCLIDDLVPYSGNARTHSQEQIAQIARSIERFGFTNPILIDDHGQIIAGHGRVEAARTLGLEAVPVIKLSHLSDDEKRAYILADNKLAENAGWDQDMLAIELQGLINVEFDVDLIGFSTTEIDIALDGVLKKGPSEASPLLDEVPKPSPQFPISRQGDLWYLGDHRLMCGDAKSKTDIHTLCTDQNGRLEQIAMMFTDPPYNVPIGGHVVGKSRTQHKEFVEASGEMTKKAFTTFLSTTLCNGSQLLKEGAIAYVCMDWRHLGELLTAGELAFDELKNVCIWNKTNGGMGTFYRSKHELVFVFKKGVAPHINNFGLGEHGRYRTNVWDYAGISSLSPTRADELAMHPTVKPVALVADAIRDCSHRGNLILDIFGGSGSTLIAAESSGRLARLLELDPTYCDVIIERYRRTTGKTVTLGYEGPTYDEVVQARNTEHMPHEHRSRAFEEGANL